MFVAVQFVILGFVGALPSAVKATLGVAGIFLALWARQWFRDPKAPKKSDSNRRPSPPLADQ